VAKVKPKRRYDSALRKQQAGQTRWRILDAAEGLFGERGYAATSVGAVAEAAGVAVDTVYATFGSKRKVLAALMDVRVGGDDLPVAVLDRPEPQAVRRERSQKKQIVMFAKSIGPILDRVRPIDDIMRGAAAVDPEVAALRAAIQQTRYENLVKFVSWIAANGSLRGGLSGEDAGAIVWTLTSPEVHRMLRGERGWGAERYTDWLAQTISRTLLD
jgi:AcrR family transcriptional regulator